MFSAFVNTVLSEHSYKVIIYLLVKEEELDLDQIILLAPYLTVIK